MRLEIDYVRTFLGEEIVFIPIYQVLLFFLTPDISLRNPFMKSTVDSMLYNGTKIIAYDNAPFQKSKKEYETLLKAAGYNQIQNIVTAKELKCKSGSLKFYERMIKNYHPKQTSYGMIGRHMNVYAKLKHLRFLTYSSPDIYPKRNVYDKQDRTDEVVERFINCQLFHGLQVNSQGYYFGYSFAGILLYYCALAIKKKAAEKSVYFYWNTRHIYEVYKWMYPKNHAAILYVDEETREDDEKNEYVTGRMREEPGYVVTGDMRAIFSKKIWKSYGNNIDRLLLELTGQSVFIAKIENGQPQWRKHHSMEEDNEKRREIKQGYMNFIKEFHEVAQSHPRIQKDMLENQGIFAAKAAAYAYDEKRLQTVHYDLVQRLTETETAKKYFNYARKFYGKVKGK